jgi:hypothetical protein
MRRFIVTIVILLMLSIAVFLTGWVSLRLEPGRYGVVTSKTGGIWPEVLQAGDFHWTAAALLPTNLHIASFAPIELERIIELQGTMPSAEIYRSFIAGEPDFSWSVTVRLLASPRITALPELVHRLALDGDQALAEWLNVEMELAVAELRSAIFAYSSSLEGSQGLLSGAAEAELLASLAARRPLLEVRGLSIIAARLPDAALYEGARQLYLAYIENYQASIEPALARASTLAAEEQVRLDILKRYGDLLERYPDLIDYLAIQAGIAPRARLQATAQSNLAQSALAQPAAVLQPVPSPPATVQPATVQPTTSKPAPLPQAGADQPATIQQPVTPQAIQVAPVQSGQP